MQTKYNTTIDITINETNYAIDVTVAQEDSKLTAVTILFREPLETQYFTVARDTALVTIIALATELATDVIIQSLTIDLPVSEFQKFDSGKCMVSLVDPEFTLGVGQILTFGAKKYAPNNWKLATDLTRIKDAAYRHFLAYLSGELIDPESNLPHLDHLATNIMFLRYFEHGKGSTPQSNGVEGTC